MGKRRKQHQKQRAQHGDGRRLRLNRIRPRMHTTHSHQHPDCYANVLGNCSARISSEHFITYALLMRIHKDPRGIFMRGLPFAPGGKWIQPETLASSILCEAHNQALQPFDGFACALYDELERVQKLVILGSRVSTVIHFNGHNLEGWMLKTLCGLVASGNAARKDATRHPRDVPEWWIRCLFGEAEFVPRVGVYHTGTIGEVLDLREQSFGMGPISDDDGKVTGLEIGMHWLEATLVLKNWSGTPTGAITSDSVYRPARLTLTAEHSEHRVHFDWDRHSGAAITLTYGVPDASGSV